MEVFVGAAKKVPFESLYLDPNNPRLAMDHPPGYQDPARLFDPDVQPKLEKIVNEVYDVAGLQLGIESQGWMPIDNIVVWQHPNGGGKNVVVEGNTRVVTLRKIRVRLQREREKLVKMTEGRRRYAPHELINQQNLVSNLDRIVVDTSQLVVVPLEAATVAELERKLPRVLAVRHITGVKEWGNYAQDLWLLTRYETIFEDKHADEKLYWDPALIEHVAHEAALSPIKTRRKILASSCFSHFKARLEDQLPDEEDFKPSDYYLFENIVKKPWLREQFGLLDGMLNIPDEFEDALFKWTFAQPRGRTADDNPNIFFRHENVLLWDQMKRYDEKHGTGFASRFNVEDPDSAPRMAEVEAEWRVHKESRQPTAVIEQLLQQLNRLDAATLISEGAFLRTQLRSLHAFATKILSMIDASSTVQGDQGTQSDGGPHVESAPPS